MALNALSSYAQKIDPEKQEYFDWIARAEKLMEGEDIHLLDFINTPESQSRYTDALMGVLSLYIKQKLDDKDYANLVPILQLLEEIYNSRSIRMVSGQQFSLHLKMSDKYHYLLLPISELDLPTRVHMGLIRNGIRSVGELLDVINGNPENLFSLRNIGPDSRDIILEKLAERYNFDYREA